MSHVEYNEFKNTPLDNKWQKAYLQFLTDKTMIDTSSETFATLPKNYQQSLVFQKKMAGILLERVRTDRNPLDDEALSTLVEHAAAAAGLDDKEARDAGQFDMFDFKYARNLAAAYQSEKFKELGWEKQGKAERDSYPGIKAKEKGITAAAQIYIDQRAALACSMASEVSPLSQFINRAQRESLEQGFLQAYVQAALDPHKDDLKEETGVRGLKMVIDTTMKEYLTRVCAGKGINYNDVIAPAKNKS